MDYNNGNYDKKQEQEIQESFAKGLFVHISKKVNVAKTTVTPTNADFMTFKDSGISLVLSI